MRLYHYGSSIIQSDPEKNDFQANPNSAHAEKWLMYFYNLFCIFIYLYVYPEMKTNKIELISLQSNKGQMPWYLHNYKWFFGNFLWRQDNIS